MGLSLDWMPLREIPAGKVEEVERVPVEKAARLFPYKFRELDGGYYERAATREHATRVYSPGEIVELYTGRLIVDPYLESCFRFYRENPPRSHYERETLRAYFNARAFPCPF